MKKIFLLLLSLIITMESFIFGATVYAQEEVLPEPYNVITNVCSETVILSWRNPVYESGDIALNKITLYDSQKTVISDSFSTESGSANMYKAENLVNGEIYSYILEFVYENGEKRNIILAAKPEEATNLLPEITDKNGFYIYSDSAIYEDAAGILFDSSVYCIEKDIKNKQSSASVKFFGNNPEGTEKSYATLYVEDALYADYEYTVSFWAKCENSGGGRVRFNGFEENDIVIPEGDMEWTKFEKTVGPVDPSSWDFIDASLEFIMNTNSGGIWIDNIEMIDSTNFESLNTTVSINHSANNSAISPEEMVKKGTGAFANAVTAEAFSNSGMGEIEFSWDENYSGEVNIKNLVSEIKVYELTDGNERLTAIMPFGMNWLVLDELENGKAYNYRYEVYRGKSKSVIAKNSAELTIMPEAVDYAKYEPQNVLINGGDGNMTISWRNPKETKTNIKTLRKIELYKINDDESESMLSDSFSLEGGSTCVFVDKELENGKTYSYRLSFLYENARTLDLYLASKTDKTTKKLGVGDSYINVSAAIGANDITVDKNVFCGEESSASLRITSNTDVTTSTRVSVGDIPYQNTRFLEGKKYRVEYDCKGENAGGGIFLVGDWAYPFYIPSGTYDWTHKKQDFLIEKAVSGFYFKPAVIPGADLWIDNLEIYELDENGNKTGSDMLASYSAENINVESYPQPVSVSASEDNITVSWSATNSIDMMKIYVQDETGTYLRAIAPSSLEKTKIGVTGFGEYTVIAKSVVGLVESDNIKTCSMQPVAKNYEVSRYILTDSNGKNIESIAGAGVYNVRIDIKNNYKGNDFTAQLIVAQFDENDEIIAVDGSCVMAIFETDVNDYSPTTFTTNINVRNNAVRVVAYLWNSISGMDELIESRNFK